MKNYSTDYNELIDSQYRVSRSNIKVYGVYRLVSYRYANNKNKLLSGEDTSLVCVVGIDGNKIHALKISLMPPKEFLEWALPNRINKIPPNKKADSVALYDVVPQMFTEGKLLYETRIKNNPKIDKWGSLYRIYNRLHISHISEILLNKEIINTYA